jgi:iron complex outermembrane receptor protein
MNSRFKVKSIVLAVGAGLVYVPQAIAQDSTQDSAQPMLETIVITARKRSESLMDAPLSVAAVSGEAMDNQGISNMEQLATSVPGLSIGRAVQTSSVFIRGIGSGINKAFEQSVGMYVDGIYQSRSRQFTQSLVDLQQVEVLRGPQGTLFGKNTIAGAIKVETATTQPGEEFGGSITLDYEPDASTTRGTVVLSGSPTDTLGARLAVRYQETDGYVDNQVFNRDEAEGEDTMARLSLVWDATDNLRFVGKVSYTDMERDGTEVVNSSVDYSLLEGVQAGTSSLNLLNVMGVIAAQAFPGYQASTGSAEYDTWNASTRYNDGDTEFTESTQVSLRFDWEAGDYTVTGQTGYTNFDFEQDHDTDFNPGNTTGNFDFEELEQTSFELRIASGYDGPLNFIAGVYYEEQDLNSFNSPSLDGSLGGVFGQLPANALNPNFPQVPLADLGINSVWNGTVLGALANIPSADNPLVGVEVIDLQRVTVFEQDTQTWAVFGELSYDLTEAITLELGLRYSEDTKDVRKQAMGGLGIPSNPIIAIGSDGVPTGNASPLETVLIESFLGLFNTFPHDQKLKREEDHLDPAVRLRWQANDDTMVYLSWSEGYKSGGFNYESDTANPDGSPGPGTEFENEEAEAWELGVKATLWDGRANISAAVFQTEITNLQVTSFQGLTFQVGNAAEMTSKGFEFEAKLAMTEDLTMGLSLQYLDAQYDSYANGPVTVYQQAAGLTTQDLSGRTPTYAPEWSGNLFAEYYREISANWLLSARVDLNYKGDHFTNGALAEASLQESYTKINARLALSNERWEVAIYARNLTDEATYTASLDAPLSAGITAAWVEEPRVIGVQLRYAY